MHPCSTLACLWRRWLRCARATVSNLHVCEQEAQRGGFWSYVAGTAAKIMTEHEVRGLSIDNHTTTLPLRKGLSSSAAICVLVSPCPCSLTLCF